MSGTMTSSPMSGATGTTVLRHEADQRVPTLAMALTYAVILRADPRELFAGRYEDAEGAVLLRARELLARSREELPTPDVAAKVAYLEDLVAAPEPHAVPCEEC